MIFIYFNHLANNNVQKLFQMGIIAGVFNQRSWEVPGWPKLPGANGTSLRTTLQRMCFARAANFSLGEREEKGRPEWNLPSGKLT